MTVVLIAIPLVSQIPQGLPDYGETVPVLWTKDFSIDLYTG